MESERGLLAELDCLATTTKVERVVTRSWSTPGWESVQKRYACAYGRVNKGLSTILANLDLDQPNPPENASLDKRFIVMGQQENWCLGSLFPIRTIGTYGSFARHAVEKWASNFRKPNH